MDPEANSRKARMLLDFTVNNGTGKGGVSIFGGKCNYPSSRLVPEGCKNYTSPGNAYCPVHDLKKAMNIPSASCANCYHILTTKHRCHVCDSLVCESCSDYQLYEKRAPKSVRSFRALFTGKQERRVCIKCATLIHPSSITKPVSSLEASPDHVPLDVCFIFNVAPSMESHISLVEQEIEKIGVEIRLRYRADARFMVAAYRDHSYGARIVDMIPPQSDEKKFQQLLGSLHVFPEFSSTKPKSMVAGLAVAQMGCGGHWRPHASKMVILFTDSTPHGRKYNPENTHDDFPDGDPSRLDPLEMIKMMYNDGITIYTISCTSHVDQALGDLAKAGSGIAIPSGRSESLPGFITTAICDTLLKAIALQELARVAGETRNPTTEAKMLTSVATQVGMRLQSRYIPQFTYSHGRISGCQRNHLDDAAIGKYITSVIENPPKHVPCL